MAAWISRPQRAPPSSPERLYQSSRPASCRSFAKRSTKTEILAGIRDEYLSHYASPSQARVIVQQIANPGLTALTELLETERAQRKPLPKCGKGRNVRAVAEIHGNMFPTAKPTPRLATLDTFHGRTLWVGGGRTGIIVCTHTNRSPIPRRFRPYPAPHTGWHRVDIYPQRWYRQHKNLFRFSESLAMEQ